MVKLLAIFVFLFILFKCRTNLSKGRPWTGSGCKFRKIRQTERHLRTMARNIVSLKSQEVREVGELYHWERRQLHLRWANMHWCSFNFITCGWAGTCAIMSKGEVVFPMNTKEEENSCGTYHQESKSPNVPLYSLAFQNSITFYLLFHCQHHIIAGSWKHWNNALTWTVKTFSVCNHDIFLYGKKYLLTNKKYYSFSEFKMRPQICGISKLWTTCQKGPL